MCKVVVIIKRFRELSLACLYGSPVGCATCAGDRLRENLGWALKKYVPGWKWDRGRPRWNILRKPLRPGILIGAGESREAMQGEADETERLRTCVWGEAWRHRRRRFSLIGKLNEFSPALVMLRGESMAGRQSLCQTWDDGSLVSTGMCGRPETGQAPSLRECSWTKCAVEMRLAASGSGESAYF